MPQKFVLNNYLPPFSTTINVKIQYNNTQTSAKFFRISDGIDNTDIKCGPGISNVALDRKIGYDGSDSVLYFSNEVAVPQTQIIAIAINGYYD